MPLNANEPQIDDRTFEQIFAELRLRIPRYSKDWTDFNDSDPGITLLQLFAWLSEMMLFRMNQVPLKNYVKFLKLLGEELEPAQPALAQLTFSTKAGTPPQPVPPRAQIIAQLDDGGDPLIFETDRALDLIQFPFDTVGIFDGASFTRVNNEPGARFRPFGWFPDPNNAVYLGFKPADPVVPGASASFAKTMTFRVFLPPEATAGEPQLCRGTTTPPIAPVTIVWEFRPKPTEPWQRLNVFEDESVAFTREGYIRVAGPPSIVPSIELRLNEEPRYWIRARLDAGSYPAGRSPEIDFLRANTVDARNLATVREEVLGESIGQPNAVFELHRKPVQLDSIRVRTENVDGTTREEWTRRDDLLASGRNDLHFTVNPTAGLVQFGDGIHGRIPDTAALVIATEYRYGGGKRGNSVGAGKIVSPATTLVGVDKVTNERPAVGGADEQTLDDLKLRAPALLKRRNRAVTPADFESLVKEMGGLAQAKALPLAHPDHPGVSVPGTITVVIVPDNDDTPPKPSGDLIRAVCQLLDEKRLLTTEVFVKGPEYQEVRVEARVSATPYASFDAVTRDIIAALNTFLDPRRRPLGEELFPSRLYSTIQSVDNVVAVSTLNIFVDGRRHEDLRDPIIVPADGLVFGSNHVIAVDAARDK